MQMAQRLRRKTGTEQQMDEDEDLDEEERSAREEEQRDIELSSSNHFRQIEFDEWLRIIVKVHIRIVDAGVYLLTNPLHSMQQC